MRKEFDQELSPEVREKMRKNLVYVGIFSVIMLFAGFTSAYIVSMGDSFWLKYPLPPAFWVSTAIIVLSSIFFELGIFYIKKGNSTLLKVFVVLTFLSGIGFVVFQMKGYKQLVDFGAHAVNNHIIVTEGRYGDYFEVKYDGSFIEVDGNKYLHKGKELPATQMKELQSFMQQFVEVKRDKKSVLQNADNKFELYYNNQPLTFSSGNLLTPEGKELEYVDLLRLSQLSTNVKDGRGDFFVKGEMGKDFQIFFKGKELQYKNRELQMNGKKLSKYLQIKAMDTADSATSYLYIITFLHLLHIVVTLLYMVRVTIHSFSGRFTAEENLNLRASAIFWHFLGLLWIYLLLFLLFIH
jgi:cytochrome c oxidase subunit 3